MNVAEHRVEAAGGRRLHVLERGAAGGIAVIGHHGTPGSGPVRPDAGALALDRGAERFAISPGRRL